MTTAIRLRSNSLFSPLFGVTLSEEYITKVAKLSSKQDATRTSIWEKIKDWLCGTNKDEIIKKFLT